MENINKNETYLILERSNTPLRSSKEDEYYILEGKFTSFDVLNENQRIYQWKEFEPHFKILQEKIKRGKSVLGNADHPSSPMSEPSLQEAAIKIERLEYDPNENCINGRVKVLSNEKGKNIKALINDGVQMSISSRALGTVRENKTVAIERLITYDLVAEPGFANANLTRVNESVGILNENVSIYKIPVNESEQNKEVDVVNSEVKKPTTENRKIDYEKYNELLNTMNENNKNEIIEILFEKVVGYIEEKITPQIQELSESIINLQRIPEYINEYFGEGEETREKLESIPAIHEYLNTVLPVQVSRLVNNNMESFKKDVDKKISTLNGEIAQATDYDRTIGGVKQNDIDIVTLKSKTNEDKVNAVIEYLTTQMPKLQEVSKYIVSNGDKMKQLSEYVAISGHQLKDKLQNIDETLSSLEENAHRNNDLETYITHQLPKINALFEYVQHMRGKVNNTNNYLNNEMLPTLVENFEMLFGMISEKLGVENYAKIVKKEETDITEQVDQILAIATKKKEQQVTNETLNFYVRQLNEKQQKEYNFLTESQRKKFVYYLNDIQPTNLNELNMIWNKVVNTNSLTEDKQTFMISNMPKMIKPLYEQLDPTSQQKILEVSNNYILDTPFKVQNFWLNRKEFQDILNKQVMESYNPGIKQDDYINNLDERKQEIVRAMRALNS